MSQSFCLRSDTTSQKFMVGKTVNEQAEDRLDS